MSKNKDYNANGFQFKYPDDWTVEEYPDAVGVTSPTEVTWLLSRFSPNTDSDEYLDEVAEALKEEYNDVDVEPFSEQINHGIVVEGGDISFFVMDLPCTARVMTLRTPFALYVLYYQAEINELDDIGPQLQLITESWLDQYRLEAKGDTAE